MSWSLDGRPLRKILITRLRYLGDIVMATAVVDLLKRGDPELDIGFLCEEAYAPALIDHDALDRLHVLGTGGTGATHRNRPVVLEPDRPRQEGWLGTVLALRRERYDLAVDLFFNPRSAWLLRCAGIPLRITGRRNRRARLYTHVAELPADPGFRSLAPGGLGEHVARLAPLSHVETGLPMMDWLASHGGIVGPRLVVSDSARASAAESLAGAGVKPGPFILLAPGATWEAKSWPADRWRALIDMLEGGGVRTVVLNPPGTDRLLEAALRDAPGTRLPPLPLSTVFGVIAAARSVVTVDGGVMHAAVALKRPTVALFGPTDPTIWFPYDHLGIHRVLATRPHCHPCDLHSCDDWICMPGLEVTDVITALTKILFGGEV